MVRARVQSFGNKKGPDLDVRPFKGGQEVNYRTHLNLLAELFAA